MDELRDSTHIPMQEDVESVEDTKKLIDAAASLLNAPIQVLLYYAGFPRDRLLALLRRKPASSFWDEVIRRNVDETFQVSRYVLREHMFAVKRRWGSITVIFDPVSLTGFDQCVSPQETLGKIIQGTMDLAEEAEVGRGIAYESFTVNTFVPQVLSDQLTDHPDIQVYARRRPVEDTPKIRYGRHDESGSLAFSIDSLLREQEGIQYNGCVFGVRESIFS